MVYVFFIILVISLLVKTIRYLRFRQVVGLFKNGSCIVFGVRGGGKDLLMSNVVAYRNMPYCSNIDYLSGKDNAPVRYPFEPVYLKLGGNTFNNFSHGAILPYSYPLPDRCDYYISDGGVYFPSQENGNLNKNFPEVPLFQALLRHLGDCNFHINVQNVNRLWDKIREQADIYILCKSCRVSKKGVVTQKIIVYDRYQSAVDKIEPLKLRRPLLGRQVKNDNTITKETFKAQYGLVKSIKLRYKIKSSYDSRRFKTILENGGQEDEPKKETV